MKYVNLIYLQSLWWAALWWREPWQSILVFSCYLLCEGLFGELKTKVSRYLQFSLLLFFYGLLTEALFMGLGLVKYDGAESFPPLWLLIFWPMFVGYYHWAFAIFKKHKFYASLFAAVAGPFVYYGVSLRGVIQFTSLDMSLLYLALSWAIFFPLSLAVHEYLLQSD